MVGFVGVEGAGHDNHYPWSFMKELFTLFPGVSKHYVQTLNTSVSTKASEAVSHALQYAKQPDFKGLVLAGYSQGGAAVIEAALQLAAQGVSVDVLALFDAVNFEGKSPFKRIPNSVVYSVHAYRMFSALSRPLWWNCGMAGLTDYKSFFVTHGAAGGTDLLYNQSPVGPPGSYVIEYDFIREQSNNYFGHQNPPNGPTRETRVTYQQDFDGAQLLWDWIMPKILARARMLEMGAPKNSSPSPTAGNGNGTGRPGSVSPSGGGKPGNGKPGGATELYTVERGDSLSIIAGKYWKDVLLWPAIWDVPQNQATIGGDWNQIDVGMKLQIPDIGGLSSGQIETLRNRGKNWR